MLERISDLDTELFLFLNSLHHPQLDSFMLFISNSLIPILALAALILGYGFRKYKSSIFTFFFLILMTFITADALSVHVLKESTSRLRPCHNKAISSYTAGHGCGGKKSFVSSHAANWFSVLTLVWLIFKRFNRLFILGFPFAAIVSYSRIYLGRHYPLDIICGALMGVSLALIVYYLIKRKTTLLIS